MFLGLGPRYVRLAGVRMLLDDEDAFLFEIWFAIRYD